MDLDFSLAQLTNNAQRVESLVEGVSEQQARWKPNPTAWSILEVVNHLRDEETEDFRLFLELALLRPGDPKPKIDPAGWVTARGYNQCDPAQSLRDFLAARAESLAWLRGLAAPNWAAVYQAPFGPITAGDILAAWVAHDLLHMRQLVELHWEYTTAQLAPHQTYYAGDW